MVKRCGGDLVDCSCGCGVTRTTMIKEICGCGE